MLPFGFHQKSFFVCFGKVEQGENWHADIYSKEEVKRGSKSYAISMFGKVFFFCMLTINNSSIQSFQLKFQNQVSHCQLQHLSHWFNHLSVHMLNWCVCMLYWSMHAPCESVHAPLYACINHWNHSLNILPLGKAWPATIFYCKNRQISKDLAIFLKLVSIKILKLANIGVKITNFLETMTT